MKTLEELVQLLAQKRQELQDFFQTLSGKKDGELAESDLTKVEALHAEIAQLEQQKAAREKMASIEEKNAAELLKLKAPVYKAPFSGGPDPSLPKTQVMTNAGETVIGWDEQTKQLMVVYEEGPLFGQKEIAAISEKRYKQAFRRYMRAGKEALTIEELKTLQEGSDQAGGFLVPDDLQSRIIEKLPTPTRVAGRVTRLTTSRDNMVFPRVKYETDNIYTTGIRVTWTGEIPASATAHRVTDPVFGQLRIPVHTAMMSMPLTNDMVEDAAFPLITWASGKFTETIQILSDDMALNGSGINQPAGILRNPGGTDEPAIVVSGDANLLKPDGLIALAFALPEQYDGDSVFVFNKTSSGLAIAQLKDTTNRYLWGSGLQDSGLVPPIMGRRLLGYETILSGLMPNVAANAFPVLFGDLGGYFLVNRIGFSIQVLRELYAETNQIVLLGRIRLGGQVAEPWRMKIQKVSA